MIWSVLRGLIISSIPLCISSVWQTAFSNLPWEWLLPISGPKEVSHQVKKNNQIIKVLQNDEGSSYSLLQYKEKE